MKIVVQGLWHLGCVTAACCARHFDVTGLDLDAALVGQLTRAQPPIAEPGLNELIALQLAKGSLRFTADPAAACRDADLLWVCYDTPVDEGDRSDVAPVLESMFIALEHLKPGTLVVISSQLPVGTCASIESRFPHLSIVCSPENLRLGKAIDAFTKAERIIVGLRDKTPRAPLEALFQPFTSQVIFMRTESAEMVKHALNSFLALSITFINEVARLCEKVQADAREVAAGLKSDPRIGPKAYLNPGGPFAGGTLARDVVNLIKLGEPGSLAVIPAIKESNDRHRQWAFAKLQAELSGLRGKTIAVLGLVYTPNTNTLRRSAAVELCQQLVKAGARVRAFDPAIATVPGELAAITLCASLPEALDSADAAVVCTEWPAFREANWPALLPTMRRPLLLDPNRFLEKQLAALPVAYLTVGSSSPLPPPAGR
jgi:UDPglucose 6-dehydrogenase